MRLVDADTANIWLNAEACEQIKHMPTVDVAPVLHGFWKIGGVDPARNVIGNWKCSLCGGTSLEDSDFCPNCGAKMEAE